MNHRHPGKNGLQVMVGGWLDDDNEHNEEEITNLIQVAKAGHADFNISQVFLIQH